MIVPWDMSPREMATVIMGGRQDLAEEAAEMIDEGYSAAPFCRDVFFELVVLLEDKYGAAACREMALYRRALLYAGIFPDEEE